LQFSLRCHPGQQAVYHKVCTEAQTLRYNAQGFDKVLYSLNERVGVNTIGEFLREICKLAGVPNWQEKTNHCLRKWAITTLANNPNVNQVETANTARHSSIQAQNAYIESNHQSDFARINALKPVAPPPFVGDLPHAPGMFIAQHLQPIVAQEVPAAEEDSDDEEQPVKEEPRDDVANGSAFV
jgi:hypothetical protein